MKLIHVNTPDQCLPRWHGLIDFDHRTHQARSCLIGLNLLVFLALRLHQFVRCLPYEVPVSPRAAFLAGMRAGEGWRNGWDAGHQEGHALGHERGYELGVSDATQAHNTAAELQRIYSRPAPPAKEPNVWAKEPNA